MIRYQKARLRVAEFFFDERETAAEADIVRYEFRPRPIAGCRWRDFHSLCLDLSRDEDFGGWYAGREDTDKLRVNRFKESFGGEAVYEYNADRANTWKGAAALAARRLRQELAQRLGGRRS